MSWRLANSLVRLRDQIDAEVPGRNKASDGTIGDARHQAQASDHNPNAAGVVCALDITHDPTHGVDTYAIADLLRIHPHPDLKYVISNGRIASIWSNWAWQRYTGPDPHTNHMHVSVGRGADGQSQPPYDDTTDWYIKARVATQADAAAANLTLDQVTDQVIRGDWGNGDDRRARLSRAGYDANAVQFIVNQKLGAHPATPAGKSNDEIATEVIRGQWGNGQDRRQRLAAAGYNYDAVQAIVNARLR